MNWEATSNAGAEGWECMMTSLHPPYRLVHPTVSLAGCASPGKAMEHSTRELSLVIVTSN